MQKLKNFLPTKTSYEDFKASKGDDGQETEKSASVVPQVGFKLTLDDGKATNRKEKDKPPELLVHLIGARHLQDSFGFKKAQGYKIKVKLFPGAMKYESEIQTSSWPKFEQNFKFQLTTVLTKSKSKTEVDLIPETIFKGNFIVFTVFALLELPVSANTLKEGFSNLKRQGSLLLKKKPLLAKYFSTDESSSSSKDDENTEKTVKPGAPILTNSESNRNLGSVTFFLDPKQFVKDKNGNYSLDETWLPIKDITTEAKRQFSNPALQSHSSLKGQIEIILLVCEKSGEIPDDPPPESPESATKKGSFKGFKNLIKMKSKSKDEQYLKITTSRMRCSIKAKEAFEKITNYMYIKTSVFNQDMPAKSWKSEKFAPGLSFRAAEDSSIYVPILSKDDLKCFNIRVSIATKNNVGKKIVLGEVNIGSSGSGCGYEHWNAIFNDKTGNPITMWHSFQ